jgi:hypothetical protein
LLAEMKSAGALERPVFTRRRGTIIHLARSLALAAIVLMAPAAGAEPQLTTGLTLGIAGHGVRSELWSSTKLTAGLRGQLLFGRDKDASFGVGPYVEALTTASFSDAQFGGGAALLVPVHPYLPIVLSAGGYAGWRDARGWEPGLAAELFWGSHGYNYHSLYALSAGVFAGGRYALGDSKEVVLLGGARVDLELIALPFLFLWGAIRGPNPTR